MCINPIRTSWNSLSTVYKQKHSSRILDWMIKVNVNYNILWKWKWWERERKKEGERERERDCVYTPYHICCMLFYQTQHRFLILYFKIHTSMQHTWALLALYCERIYACPETNTHTYHTLLRACVRHLSAAMLTQLGTYANTSILPSSGVSIVLYRVAPLEWNGVLWWTLSTRGLKLLAIQLVRMWHSCNF